MPVQNHVQKQQSKTFHCRCTAEQASEGDLAVNVVLETL